MAATVTVVETTKQAEQLRLDGNMAFKKDKFGAAIDAYTEAITLCPNVPIYWTNRALCHLKRNNWTRVEEDCRRAIQLDHHSVKVLDSDIYGVSVTTIGYVVPPVSCEITASTCEAVVSLLGGFRL